jgi:hypothetical protein
MLPGCPIDPGGQGVKRAETLEQALKRVDEKLIKADQLWAIYVANEAMRQSLPLQTRVRRHPGLHSLGGRI